MTQTTALLLTLAIELPVLALLRPALGRPPWIQLLIAGVAASLVTHPFAWWTAQALPGAWAVRFAAVELGVVGIETIVYRLAVPLALRRAVLASLITNAVSAGVGLLL